MPIAIPKENHLITNDGMSRAWEDHPGRPTCPTIFKDIRQSLARRRGTHSATRSNADDTGDAEGPPGAADYAEAATNARETEEVRQHEACHTT